MNPTSNHHTSLQQGVVDALLAAVLFGASMLFAKALAGQLAPVALAGMLYIGSGLGLLVLYLARGLAQRNGSGEIAGLTCKDRRWLGGAILASGVAGPML